MNQEDTIEIFTVLLQSLRNKGLKKTINLLKGESVHNSNNEFDNSTKFVIDSVCNEFSIKFDEISSTKYSRGENKYIIGFIVFYLYQNLSLKVIQKNVFFNLTKSLLSNYKQLIFDLDKDKIRNEKYITIKKILDVKILK